MIGQDLYQWTTLVEECKKQGIISDSFAERLLQKQDIHYEDSYGRTLLFFVMEKENLALMQSILSHRSFEINKANRLGQTPLSMALRFATQKNNPDILDAVLAHPQCEVRQKDKMGRTGLALAKERGGQALQEILLESERKKVDSVVRIRDSFILNAHAHYGEFGSNLDENTQLDRLSNSMQDIFRIAKEKLANWKPGKNDITRVMTNEFAFYTKKPLTLEEFTILQNKIYLLAKEMPPNVHLLLSSFAVKTSDNKIMNIASHVECGPKPKIHCVAKKNPSGVDPVYTEMDVNGIEQPLLYVSNEKPLSVDIKVNEETVNIGFKNVFECTTAGGAKFYTAIDICLDYKCGCAQTTLKEILQTKTELLPLLQYSHIITSHTITNQPEQAIGKMIVQADPNYAKKSLCRLANKGVRPLFNQSVKMVDTPQRPLTLLPSALLSLQPSTDPRIFKYLQQGIEKIKEDNFHFLYKQEIVYCLLRDNIHAVKTVEELEKIFNCIIQYEDTYRRISETELGYPSGFESILYLIKARALEMQAFNDEHPLIQAIEFYERDIHSFKKEEIGIFYNKSGKPYLHKAIEKNDQQRIEELCEKGIHLNRRNADRETPLEVAIRRNDSEAAENVLLAGADVNVICSSGLTPLEFAMQHNNRDILELLILNGADVNQSHSKDALLPLMRVYLLGESPQKYEIIKMLFSEGALVSLATFQGQSLLDLGIELQDRILLKLISKFSQIPENKAEKVYSILQNPSYTHKPVLMAACGAGNIALVNYLMKHTFVDSVDAERALNAALNEGQMNVVERLLNKFPTIIESDPFLQKIQSGDIEAVKAEMESVGYLNIFRRRFNKLSPFDLAIIMKNEEMIHTFLDFAKNVHFALLIDFNCWVKSLPESWIVKIIDSGYLDINEDDKNSNTLLMSAILSHKKNLVEKLLERAANVNQINLVTGQDPLILAIQMGDIEIIKQILHHRKDEIVMTRMDSDGDFALSLAVKMNNIDIVKILLEYASKEALAFQDSDKKCTALGYALLCDNEQMLDVFLNSSKIDLNQPTYGVLTPLTVAVALENVDLAKKLLDKGAILEQPDGCGKTALDYAQGKTEILDFLNEYKQKKTQMQAQGVRRSLVFSPSEQGNEVHTEPDKRSTKKKRPDGK